MMETWMSFSSSRTKRNGRKQAEVVCSQYCQKNYVRDIFIAFMIYNHIDCHQIVSCLQPNIVMCV